MKLFAVTSFLLAYQVLLIDVPSAVYASLVVPLLFHTDSRLSFWALWLAKYNGFSVNLATTYLLLAVMRNAKKLLRDRVPCIRYRNIVEYFWGWPTPGLNKQHAYYTYRVLAAGVLHTVAHVTVVHPFRLLYDASYQLPIKLNDLLLNSRPEYHDLSFGNRVLVVGRSLIADTHTWTGYSLLLLLFAAVLPTGIRLSRYARRHFTVLNLHRLFAAITVPLYALHHPIRFWPAFWLLVYVLDYALGLLFYTEQCQAIRVYRYPNHQLEDPAQLNDVIDVSFRYPYRKIERFQPGDYVRVKIPSVSHLEWHDFTLMKVSENATILDTVVHLTIRSVGSWTKRAYLLLAEGETLLVKGPYSLVFYNPLIERILQSSTSRFTADDYELSERVSSTTTMYDDDGDGSEYHVYERVRVRIALPNDERLGSCCYCCFCCCCRRYDLSAIPMPRTLVMVCTGTAITHFLSILDVLIPLYYVGYRSSELPQKIVVCWTVRTVFNLNFALIPLAKYQRRLALEKLDDLLSYEFFVTEMPENTEALAALNFRRLLMRIENESAAANGRRCNEMISTLSTMSTVSTIGGGGCGGSGGFGDSLFIRNSRLSTLDLVGKPNVSTTLGYRPNYEALANRYLAGPKNRPATLIVNSSVRTVLREFERIAKKYECELHSESLF